MALWNPGNNGDNTKIEIEAKTTTTTTRATRWLESAKLTACVPFFPEKFELVGHRSYERRTLRNAQASSAVAIRLQPA
jgi:hypothetical protein